ncbi:ankyrin repeat domain-containing protein 26 isoform X3 [Sarcophilus harrisii]|nr:ankyrin repeat domain-containing protein 26 isoform X3 [Sarcophilus harrisii]
MKKIFNFGSKKGQSPSRSFAVPRRDCGVPESDTSAGYLLRDKELGKLHKAASVGDVAKVQQLLLLGKHDVNDLDKVKRTPLHLACAKGYPDVVSLLVQRKCKLNLCDNDNRTPLIKAVQCQQEECATILLEHGADPNLVDSNNNTALHYAASGQNKAIAAQLLKHKGDIEAKNKEGYTPLLLAVTENNHDIVDFFLKNGANVNASDKSKRTALMIAVSSEPTGIVSLLLGYDVDLSCQDIYGWTVEQYAKLSGYPIHRQLINQYEIQKERNQHLSPQINCSKRVSSTGFILGGPALDKEVEESSAEESLSRLSDKPGADDSWPTTDDEELDFTTKKLPKSNITKIINVSQQIRKSIDEKSSTVNTEHRTFLGHHQSDSEKEDMTDSLPKPSSQAQCSPHPAHPSLRSFSKSSHMMSTLLAINKKGKDSRNGSSQKSHHKKIHDYLRIKDKTLMGLKNSCVNSQKEEELESNQEEGQLEDYEGKVAEEEESEEEEEGEEEEYSQDVQDVIDGEEESDYVDTEDEDEEDFENTKEKEGVNNHQNLCLPTVKYDRIEAKCKISKEKQVTNISTEFPVSVITDIYGKSDATSLKEDSTDSEEEEKEDGILVDNDTGKQTPHETPSIPNEHSTSARSVVRKDMMSALGLEEEDDAESPWDSECTSESLPKGSSRHMLAATNQTIKNSISMEQLEDVPYIPSFLNESRNFKMDKLTDTRSIRMPVGSLDHPQRNPIFKPIQSTLEMKDSFTNQEVEKEVKEKQKSDFMEEFGLDDADDIDDASDWDSTSISQKNESHRNSKDLNFNGNYPCKSLPLIKNWSGSTEFEKIPLKEDEATETATEAESGPATRFRVATLVENAVLRKQCESPLEKEDDKEDFTRELEFKGSSEGNQESFDKSDQEQDKVTLETANIPEQTAFNKQVKPLDLPVLYLKRMPQGPECNKKAHGDDVHLEADPNWEEKYEKMWVAEEKMEVKKNFKIITTELKQMFGEIYEKDKIADQPTEKLQEEILPGFEEELKQLQEVSPSLTNNSSDSEEKKKHGGPFSVEVLSFPRQREYGMESATLQNLKLIFDKNVLQSSCNLCSESSNLHLKNDNKPEIECTCDVNEEDIAYNAENIKRADSKRGINEMKEDEAFGMQMAGSLNKHTTNLEPDSGRLLQSNGLGSQFAVCLTCSDEMKSVVQEKKPTLITATKFNEKTKVNETLFQNSDHNANNATNKLRHWRHSLPYSDKISNVQLDKELKEDMQRFKNELGILQVEFLTLEKEKIQLQKEVEEEKKKHQHNEMETLEGKNGDKLSENIMAGKVNELFSMESNQLNKDDENKIPREEIPIMSISKEISAPVHHLLKNNDFATNRKNVKKPQNNKWIPKDPGMTLSSEKVNSSSGILLHSCDDSSLSETDNYELRPAKKTLNEKNKDKVQVDADDLDDLTQSSDTATEDYDLPPSNYKNIMLLIEQLSVDCKDSIHLLKIQDAVLKYERSVELKKARCTQLKRKVKSLENKITGLQEELSETRKMKSQLEHQKVEWDRELYRLRFTLKQEKEKQLSTEMLFEKTREQLRRKEEQYSKEVELKQQLEFTLRTLDLELRTVKSNFKQVEEERNDAQRQLSREQSARVLQDGILNNYLWKQKEIEAAASKMIQSSEVPDSHEKEKCLLHENQSLLDEVAKLKLELDTIKIKDQEKEDRYTEENEVLKEKNDELQKELKLKEEALRETIFQYSGQVNVLTTENTMLSSKLDNEKQNRDKLETEVESYRSRLNSAILDHERSQTSKLDLENIFQRERDEWLHLQDKLRDNNGVLSQELSKAESKANRLENELYQVCDSLREKTLILESTQRELNQTQNKAKELENKNQMDKEKLDRYIIKQESIQERLAQIQSENMLLRQQLEDAQNKGVIKEKVVNDVQVQFSDLFNKLRADTEKQVLLVEERNKELINECNHLREQMCKYENEKAEREGTVRKLQQELADSLKKQSMTEASLEVTSRYRNDLEDKKKQLQKEVDQIKSKLQESQERHIQSQRSTNELEDHIQKLEIENARLEATVKQQVGKIENIQKNILDSTKLDTEREKLKKLIELKQSLENRLEQEMKRNDELQKDVSGFKKLLKTTKKKLREYEKGEVISQEVLKQTHFDEDRQINRLKNKNEDLTQQLEATSSKCIQLESINRNLREELLSMKSLQKKCDRLERNKRELEEEVVDLKHHLEITKLEHSQVEQYKREIEERANQEIVEKLKEVNLFLQTQAATQDYLEQSRENSNASIRNQMENRIRDLEAELSKMKNSHQDSTKAELEIYRQLYSEELKIRESLSNKLDRTNERLAELSSRLLNEKQKSRILINSFTTSPVLEPPHVGDLHTTMVLNRRLIPRGNLLYSTGNTVSSTNSMEAYLTKMRQELDKSISRELDEANAEFESRSCWAFPVGSTDESTRMPNLNQDPVSRATQEYLEVLKKNYML